jgi:hypothetical protein
MKSEMPSPEQKISRILPKLPHQNATSKTSPLDQNTHKTPPTEQNNTTKTPPRHQNATSAMRNTPEVQQMPLQATPSSGTMEHQSVP